MNNEFKDITGRLGRPLWYDAKGYPRYCKFHPSLVSNIYAEMVAYVLIGCQRCSRRWRVAVAAGRHETIELPTKTDIGSFHYVDPPNHDCPAGNSMNSIPFQVLQFWSRKPTLITPYPKWARVKRLEIKIEVDWLKENTQA